MKTKSFFASAIFTMILLLVGLNTSMLVKAHASTWHNGIPKVLRGKYQNYKHHNHILCNIYKNGMDYYLFYGKNTAAHNDGPQSSVKTQRVNKHVYIIKGRDLLNMTFNSYIYKDKNKIKVTSKPPYSFKKIGWLYRY
ncbi:hypothetical protein PVK23_11480 [Lentilactobacillus parabuchneri]|uniref:hypothetical protein n=1 Tax=Lentilactobacillus parabuchneri TaxID=152331 RepID=UPI00070BFBAA|nr:hypothetical protein [Lentilactobacillus parabuchneri]MDG9738426.1 hypothetical protein [Lentilactobacillus parabuchneri]